MKRTFLAKRNALLSSARFSWGAVVLVVAIFALLARLLLPNMFWYALAPAFRAANTLAAESHSLLSGFSDTATLALRNEELASENAALASENRTLLQKMTDLQALPGSSLPKASDKPILAGVVARPPMSPYDTLMLGSGSNAGVVSGMEAFGDGGVPIGIVSSVLPDFSRVTLFSAPNITLHAWVGHHNTPVSAMGAGAGVMRASVARSADIQAGDAVFAPGPGALVVGSVVRVDSDPSSPSVTLQIQPAANLFSLTWVELRAASPVFTESFSWATSTAP